MKNILLIGLLLTSFAFDSLAQGDVSKARWISSGIKIDGFDKDWDQPLNFYDDTTGLMYAIGNDKENLFLCFTVKEDRDMRKLMNAGWSIVLSSKEKANKFKSELSFPGVKMMEMRKSENVFEKKPGINTLITNYKLLMTTVLCKGFRSNMTNLTLGEKNNINIGINADSSRHIVYEIAIPLNELFIPESIHLDELITMNVTVNALERPNFGGGQGGRRSGSFGGGGMGGRMQEGGMGGGGMSGGMGGGMGGGRHGGGMPGGMRGERSDSNMSGEAGNMFSKVSFKQKFTLTGNQN